MEMRREILEAKMGSIDSQLKATIKPFKRYPEIQRWKALFKKVQSRYPFLVLEGSSCTGKTFFAKWMDGDPKYCYECNCACSEDPDLRGFDPLQHQTILFDEGTPSMVIRQKKLFQAPPGFVSMGNSVTNCHAYTVMVSGTKMVVCSNAWTSLLNKETDEDKAWLIHNSVHLNVGNEKMY